MPLCHSIGFFTRAAAVRVSTNSVSVLPLFTTVVYTSFLYLLMYQLPAVETGVGNQLPPRPPSMVAAVSTVRQYGYAAFSLN